MDATYKTCKLALPLFFLVVKTNVGYSIIAKFIIQHEDTFIDCRSPRTVEGNMGQRRHKSWQFHDQLPTVRGECYTWHFPGKLCLFMWLPQVAGLVAMAGEYEKWS